MGLDVNFYAIRKEEVGYFRKINFMICTTILMMKQPKRCRRILG